MLHSRLLHVLIFSALALLCGHAPAHAQATWTTLRAHVVRADFPFPTDFDAQSAIAVHDTDGNCRIDSRPGDADSLFPFLLTPQSVTIGRHVGSPFSVVPSVDADGHITVTPAPGFCGHTLIYGQMVQNGTTYFLWFALPDNRAAPAGYDPMWGIDFGIGSYTGSNVLTASQVRHATYVQDFHTNNGTTTDRTGFLPIRWYAGSAGTFASPGHVFSTEADPTRPWPAAWGLFVAGTLAGDPFLNTFVGFDNVVVDVPLVAEASWDGASMYPGAVGFGRTISPLGGGATTLTSGPAMATPTSNLLRGDFNGDGKADLALWRAGWASVPIYASTGSGFTISNVATPAQMNWINDPAASRLLGDFTGDGKTDVAMWKPGWSTIPVYASLGNGGFAVTNGAEPSGANLINQSNPPDKLVGDFDGDGRDDVALMRSDWGSVPIYFANGNGTFRWTNYATPQNQNWINWSGVRRLLGDFNFDGKTDILVTRRDWTASVLYLSSGGGWFTAGVGATGANWINDPQASPLVGDFDGDHRTDVAFWKPGWSSTPVYFSNGNGTWRITNFVTSAAEVNDLLARKHVGDFNGDGKTDIAVTRAGYATVPVYLSTGTGAFTRTTRALPFGTGPYLNGNVEVLVGEFGGDGRADLVSRALGWSSIPMFTSTLAGGFAAMFSALPLGQRWINE